jgi:hypothetical protein
MSHFTEMQITLRLGRVVNDKLDEVLNEVGVVYFRVLSRHLPEDSD